MSLNKSFPQKSFFLAMCLISFSAIAHNQNPASIRRAMDKAYKVLEAPMPANVLKGQSTLRVAGATAQVFEAKKDGLVIGKVAQVEIQEIVYVIAIGSDGLVKSVIRDGSALESADWTGLTFVEETRKGLSLAKK